MAVTASAMSNDTVWFITAEQDLHGRSELSTDDYDRIIPAGVQVFCGKFLEHICFQNNSQVFQVRKHTTHLYRDNVA